MKKKIYRYTASPFVHTCNDILYVFHLICKICSLHNNKKLMSVFFFFQQKNNNKNENIPASSKVPAKDVDKKRNTTSKTVNNNTKLSIGLKEQSVNNNTNLQQSGKMEQNSSKR